jgi:hypothetical protein
LFFGTIKNLGASPQLEYWNNGMLEKWVYLPAIASSGEAGGEELKTLKI